jgi:site-specific recombinase XerD
VYSRHTLREGAKADDVRDILGHVDIRVTQNVYTQFNTIDGTQDGSSYL